MLQRLIADANYKEQTQNVEKTKKTKEKKKTAGPLPQSQEKKHLGIHYLEKQKSKNPKKIKNAEKLLI